MKKNLLSVLSSGCPVTARIPGASVKKVFVILSVTSVLLLVDACGFLGIGKRCYVCTTEAAFASQSAAIPKITKEVCGDSDMQQYKSEAPKNVGGIILKTTCANK